MVNNAISNVVYFGVGCFHFGVKKSPPFALQGSDYLRELQNQLEAIPNTSRIAIDDYGDLVDFSMDVGEPFTPIGEGYNFFPPPARRLKIEFDIYLPYRLQRELLSFDREPSTHTERFRIYIHNHYYFPVMFVELIEPSEDCEPSDSVAIIREFLKKHFEESKSDYVRFDYLGPSPFHADFFLQPGVTQEQEFDNSGFRCEKLHQKGYDRIDFFFDPSVYENANQAKDHLFGEFGLGSEIAVFYRTVHQNRMKMRSWEQLQYLVNELVKAHETGGVKALWNTIFKVPKQIRELVISVAAFETNELFIDHDIQTAYRTLTHDRKELFIDSYLKAEMQDLPAYKCSQIRDLVELLETQRSKTTEGIITILAAILGGAIGAVITLLVTVW